MNKKLFSQWGKGRLPAGRYFTPDPAAGDFVLCLPSGFTADAGLLSCMAEEFCCRDADFVYTDGDDGGSNACPAYIKPDFSPDLLRSCNYIGSCYAFRRELAEDAGVADSMGDYERVLRLTERARSIRHIPRVLYSGRETAEPQEVCIRAVREHLERVGLKGTVLPGIHPGSCRIAYALQGDPAVSVLIPNKDHPGDLKRCVDSIREKTDWDNWEIILIENNSTGGEIFSLYSDLLADPRIRLVTYPGPFNYSAVIDHGTRFSRGQYILQLNNDTQVISAGWLREMLALCRRPDVGAAGAMLYYGDDTVQHAGVVLGKQGTAEHAFRYVPRGSRGYLGRLYAVQDYSAVTGACLMMPRLVWDRLGGMDTRFAVAYNDVDLCLRCREAGYRVLFTPWAELYHYESQSRGLDITAARQRRSIMETDLFARSHRRTLRMPDPWYMPGMPLC